MRRNDLDHDGAGESYYTPYAIDFINRHAERIGIDFRRAAELYEAGTLEDAQRTCDEACNESTYDAIAGAQRTGYDLGYRNGEDYGRRCATLAAGKALFVGTLIGTGIGSVLTVVILGWLS